MNLTILIAIIGAVAVILAAIIGGIFGLIPYLMERSQQPPIPTTTSTEKISININQMHGGSISMSPAGYVKHGNETKFELQMGGVLYYYNCARFSLASSGNGLYAVDRLYIKLHGYEKCKLRDEFSTTQAFGGISAYHFYISPEYAEYDIVPLKPPGSFGTWHYKGEDFDEFFVDFDCEPYTLFIR